LNKVSDASPAQVDAARKIIRSLNADAEIFETDPSELAAENILDTALSDFNKIYEHSIWCRSEEAA
jgi:G3E family GTPase